MSLLKRYRYTLMSRMFNSDVKELNASTYRRSYLRSLICNRQLWFLLLALSSLLLLYGCAGRGNPSFYIRQDYDFSYIKKVAVLPLDNLTNEKFAADAVKQVVICELLSSGLVDVVVPGEAEVAAEKIGLRSMRSLNAEQIKALGNVLKVQAVVFGAVEKYGEVRTGNISSPEVTITLMMADAGSGSIVWSVTRTGGGASFMARHFGAKSETMSETVIRVVRESIETLYK